MMSIRSPLARLLAPLPTHLRADAARRYARQEAVLLDRLGSCMASGRTSCPGWAT